MAILLGYLRSVYESWVDFPLRDGIMLAGKYRIVRFLGMGSYGLTYVCHDVRTGEELVVKQAKPSKGRLGRELLQREIDIVRQLEHPAIPRCMASFEYKKGFFMASEYVKGQTVEDLIFARGAVFSEQEALRIVRSVMEIVRFIHDRGFVHLDIRIPNVMLQEERVRLIDFGLASQIGEPARLEPDAVEEAILRRTAEVSSDLYAIGHFLLFMLYSRYEPAEAGVESGAGWQEELDITDATKRIIRKLLQIDERYEDTNGFIGELEEALSKL
jgi:serine/threonine-protein kinase